MKEYIRLTEFTVSGNVLCYTGQQGDFYVSIIPSLNVSGYGENYFESLEDVKHSLSVFLEDLQALSLDEKRKELKRCGWEKHRFFKKARLVPSNVKGIDVEMFDNPDSVKVEKIAA